MEMKCDAQKMRAAQTGGPDAVPGIVVAGWAEVSVV